VPHGRLKEKKAGYLAVGLVRRMSLGDLLEV
jgi:hypothetical protein